MFDEKVHYDVEIVPDFLNLHDPFVYNLETDKCHGYFEVREAIKIIREQSLSLGMSPKEGIKYLEVHNETLENVKKILEEINK
ncbi:hypothetical protein [Novibacillus thermophilus]|uniref:Uncharacterized protein n=1 Tax=Novibacillus thermophilus TaxID=1471761 RepID=A0A1U9K6I3_9BACL|nr:hypothetical protein [Novibacillus thermophilus]AQS55669.1 hypothetical protein B0W44_07590 [Novibacillus thermophilus]